MQSFLTSESGLWRRVRYFCRYYRKKSFVAVPYLGKGASKILKLSKRSVLVVNAADRTIRAGQTNPYEILKFIKKGINVYSLANLHAKVYVFGKTAIIGSNNVSSNSENNLLEAAVETRDRKIVSEAKLFIEGLLANQITPQHAVNLMKIYIPPKISGRKRRNHKQRFEKEQDKPCWIVAIYSNYDKDDRNVSKEEEPKAKRLINTRKYLIESIGSSGKSDRLYRDAVEGQDIIVIDKRKKNLTMVSSPSKIVHVFHYKVGRQYRVMIFYQRKIGISNASIEKLKSKLTKKDFKLMKIKGTVLVKRNIHEFKNVLLKHK